MNYIISGGLGFIGKNLSITLDRMNEDFMVLDSMTGCDLCKVSIREPKCSTFVHLAASTNIRKSLKDPSKTILCNTRSTLKCLEYARQTNAHFIFASSMGAPQALSPYSASKLACESFCSAYRESFNVNTTILCLSSVYGPHSMHKESVIAKFIKCCFEQNPMTIYGDGLQTRDFVHVDDVVKTILNCNGQRMLNVATGRAISVIQIADTIRTLSDMYLNYMPDIKFLDPIQGEVTETELKSDIIPIILLEDGLERTFQWYLEHYKH